MPRRPFSLRSTRVRVAVVVALISIALFFVLREHAARRPRAVEPFNPVAVKPSQVYRQTFKMQERSGVAIDAAAFSPGSGVAIDAAAFSPDGHTVAALVSQQKAYVLQLWDRNTGKLRVAAPKQINSFYDLRDVVFSPTGQYVAVNCMARVDLWDPVTLTRVAVHRLHPSRVDQLQFSPDGLQLWGCDGRAILHWKVPGGPALKPLTDGIAAWVVGGAVPNHREVVANLSYAPRDEGDTARINTRLALWDIVSGKKRWEVDAGCREPTLNWSRDGKSVIAGGGINRPGVSVFDAVSGLRRRTIVFPDHNDEPYGEDALAILNQAGDVLLVSSLHQKPSEKMRNRLYSYPALQPLRHFATDPNVMTEFWPDDSTICVLGRRGYMTLLPIR